MEKFDYLVDHALKNVWGAPGQDRQFIVQPARLTPLHGRVRVARVHWADLELPDTTSRWHVYQIGGWHPLIFNLFVQCFTWTNIASAATERKMIAQLYTMGGFSIPLSQTFYRFTEDQNLIIAVKINAKLPVDLETQPVHLRVYSNAFYNSPRSASLGQLPITDGRLLTSAALKTQMKNVYTTNKAKSVGKTWLYVNGLVYEQWDDTKIAIGDSVEIVYDPSVYKVVRHKVGDLLDFESQIDTKRKYLIRYDGPSLDTIDYQDDIDVHLYQPRDGEITRGVIYHKNNEDALRNLTHRDYSIVVPYVRQYADALELLSTPRAFINEVDMNVELVLRHSGLERPLVFTHNRIHELYRMDDEDVTRAMHGVDSTVEVWQAGVLEASTYNLIMRSKCCDVSNLMVEQAYGYNAITKVIGDTPMRVPQAPAMPEVDVPYRLQFGATAYEYDEDGSLLGWHHHYVGSKYICQETDAYYVEMIAGLGGDRLEEFYGVQTMPTHDDRSYRVYECTAISGNPDHRYKDVTGNFNKYTIIDGVFTWINPQVTAYPLVRSDKRFFARDYELDLHEGQLRIRLEALKENPNDLTYEDLYVPMGQMDVMLNGKSLLRGMEYFVEYPYVYITGKTHLITPLSEKQKVHIRIAGFCKQDLSLLPEGDIGFVEHGVLSNNKRYDIRDDKVQRIILGGKLVDKTDLVFSEFHQGTGTLDVLNGTPYMVKDLVVPTSPLSQTDTYVLRDSAALVDKAVSDYLTLKIPQPPRPAPTAVQDKTALFSPFCNKLIFDLIYGRLNLTVYPNGYTKQQVMEVCKTYEYLLKVDPTQEMNQQDLRYVVIHPHGLNHIVELPVYQYQFMFQVVEQFMRGMTTLSPAVRMLNNP